MKLNKANVQDVKPCRKIVEIEVSKEEVTNEVNNILNIMEKVAVVPGFRVGKVPRDVLFKEFKERIEKDSLQRLVDNACQIVCEEKKLVPITPIDISDVKFDLNKDLFFKATFEVMSEIKLKKYKNIAINKQKVSITEEDVDKVIKYLQQREAAFVPREDKVIEKGDLVMIDFEGFSNEKSLEKFKGEDFNFEVGKNMIFESFENNIIGMKHDEKKQVKIVLPNDYYEKEFQGKEIDVKIHVKTVKEKRFPALDDEFVKSVSECSSMAELKEHIKKELLQGREEDSVSMAKGEILKKLVAENPFDVAQSFVDNEYNNMLEELHARMKSNNINYESMGTTEEKVKEEYKKIALERVMGTFILETIATLENIKPTEEEIKNKCNSIIGRYKDKKIEEFYSSEKGQSQVAHSIILQKTLDFLFDNAKITEVNTKANS